MIEHWVEHAKFVTLQPVIIISYNYAIHQCLTFPPRKFSQMMGTMLSAVHTAFLKLTPVKQSAQIGAESWGSLEQEIIASYKG